MVNLTECRTLVVGKATYNLQSPFMRGKEYVFRGSGGTDELDQATFELTLKPSEGGGIYWKI